MSDDEWYCIVLERHKKTADISSRLKIRRVSEVCYEKALKVRGKWEKRLTACDVSTMTRYFEKSAELPSLRILKQLPQGPRYILATVYEMFDSHAKAEKKREEFLENEAGGKRLPIPKINAHTPLVIQHDRTPISAFNPSRVKKKPSTHGTKSAMGTQNRKKFAATAKKMAVTSKIKAAKQCANDILNVMGSQKKFQTTKSEEEGTSPLDDTLILEESATTDGKERLEENVSSNNLQIAQLSTAPSSTLPLTNKAAVHQWIANFDNQIVEAPTMGAEETVFTYDELPTLTNSPKLTPSNIKSSKVQKTSSLSEMKKTESPVGATETSSLPQKNLIKGMDRPPLKPDEQSSTSDRAIKEAQLSTSENEEHQGKCISPKRAPLNINHIEMENSDFETSSFTAETDYALLSFVSSGTSLLTTKSVAESSMATVHPDVDEDVLMMAEQIVSASDVTVKKTELASSQNKNHRENCASLKGSPANIILSAMKSSMTQKTSSLSTMKKIEFPMSATETPPLSPQRLIEAMDIPPLETDEHSSISDRAIKEAQSLTSKNEEHQENGMSPKHDENIDVETSSFSSVTEYVLLSNASSGTSLLSNKTVAETSIATVQPLHRDVDENERTMIAEEIVLASEYMVKETKSADSQKEIGAIGHTKINEKPNTTAREIGSISDDAGLKSKSTSSIDEKDQDKGVSSECTPTNEVSINMNNGSIQTFSLPTLLDPQPIRQLPEVPLCNTSECSWVNAPDTDSHEISTRPEKNTGPLDIVRKVTETAGSQAGKYREHSIECITEKSTSTNVTPDDPNTNNGGELLPTAATEHTQSSKFASEKSPSENEVLDNVQNAENPEVDDPLRIVEDELEMLDRDEFSMDATDEEDEQNGAQSNQKYHPEATFTQDQVQSNRRSESTVENTPQKKARGEIPCIRKDVILESSKHVKFLRSGTTKQPKTTIKLNDVSPITSLDATLAPEKLLSHFGSDTQQSTASQEKQNLTNAAPRKPAAKVSIRAVKQNQPALVKEVICNIANAKGQNNESRDDVSGRRSRKRCREEHRDHSGSSSDEEYSNIHNLEKLQAIICDLIDSEKRKEKLNVQASGSRKKTKKVDSCLTVSNRDCKKIALAVRKEVVKALPKNLLRQDAHGSIDEETEKQLPDEDGMLALTPTIRLQYDKYVDACEADTLQKRCNAVVRALWSDDERKTLIFRNIKNPEAKGLRIITKKELDNVKTVCKIIDKNNCALNGPRDEIEINTKDWISELLKGEKRRCKENYAADQALYRNMRKEQGGRTAKRKESTASVSNSNMSNCDENRKRPAVQVVVENNNNDTPDEKDQIIENPAETDKKEKYRSTGTNDGTGGGGQTVDDDQVIHRKSLEIISLLTSNSKNFSFATPAGTVRRLNISEIAESTGLIEQQIQEIVNGIDVCITTNDGYPMVLTKASEIHHLRKLLTVTSSVMEKPSEFRISDLSSLACKHAGNEYIVYVPYIINKYAVPVKNEVTASREKEMAYRWDTEKICRILVSQEVGRRKECTREQLIETMKNIDFMRNVQDPNFFWNEAINYVTVEYNSGTVPYLKANPNVKVADFGLKKLYEKCLEVLS